MSRLVAGTIFRNDPLDERVEGPLPSWDKRCVDQAISPVGHTAVSQDTTSMNVVLIPTFARVGLIDATSTGVTKKDIHALMSPCTLVIFDP
jgi:hypothetical protein